MASQHRWERAWSPDQKRHYYYERRSGQSQWTEPPGFDLKAADTCARSIATSKVSDLPQGWKAAAAELPDGSVRVYYYDELTRRRTWFKPPNMDDVTIKRSAGDAISSSRNSSDRGSEIKASRPRTPVLVDLIDDETAPRRSGECDTLRAPGRPMAVSASNASQDNDLAKISRPPNDQLGRRLRRSLVDLVEEHVSPRLEETSAVPSEPRSKASTSGKWDFGWSPDAGRYYYYDRRSDETHWRRPAGCSLEVPSEPPIAKDLVLQGQQWEHEFRMEMLGAEHANLQNQQETDASLLDALCVKIAGPLQEGRGDDRSESQEIRDLMACVKKESGYLWDVLEAAPLTLATLQVEVQALEERMQGRVVGQRKKGLGNHETPPRLSEAALL